MGIQSSKVFVIQWIHHVAIQESDKSSSLTGRTLCIAKKLSYTICDVGHPHEMVFVEPSHIFLGEMIGDHNDVFAFELWSLPGVSKVTISVVTLFSLTSEDSAKLFGHILWENVCRVDGGVTEVKHTQFCFLFGSSVNLYFTTRLLLPLTSGRIVFVCIRCCGITLASVTLFGHESSVGSRTRCTICKGILIILPWSAGLGIIPKIIGVGSNGTRHDRNSGHGSLMQVDFGSKMSLRLLRHFSVHSCWAWWSGKFWSWYYHSPNHKWSWQSSWKFAKGNCSSTYEAKALSQRYQTNAPSLDCWLWRQSWEGFDRGLADAHHWKIDGGDDHVHIDAKTGEVHRGMHSTNASNCSLSLGLVRVGKNHDVLRCSFYLAWKLLFDKNFIPLKKKSRRFHWIGLNFETSNILGCKIPLGHMGRKDHWHDLNWYLSRLDTGEVLMLGQL